MIKQIAPYVLEAGKTVLLDYLESRTRGKTIIVNDPVEDHSCPYCTIARYLTFAHRLLRECEHKPESSSLLLEAVSQEVNDAVRAAHRANPSMALGRVISHLHKIEVALLRAKNPTERTIIIDDIAITIDLCVDLALSGANRND